MGCAGAGGLAVAGVLASGVFLFSCTGLEPAAISAGASAAQTGVTFITRGKARTFELASFDDVVTAVHRAGDKLGMKSGDDPSVREPIDEPLTASEQARAKAEAEAAGPNGVLENTDTRHKVSFYDEHNEWVVVLVERRTPSVTMIQTNVGTFGEEALASLFMRQVFAELNKMNAYLDNWDFTDPRGGGGGVSAY